MLNQQAAGAKHTAKQMEKAAGRGVRSDGLPRASYQVLETAGGGAGARQRWEAPLQVCVREEGAFTTFSVLRASGTHHPEALVAFSKFLVSVGVPKPTFLGLADSVGLGLVCLGGQVSLAKQCAPEPCLLYLRLQISFLKLFLSPLGCP